MDNQFQWLRERGISVEDGLGYTGGESKYASALQRYFGGYEANRKAVGDLLSSGDIYGYAIKVHALKSNSRMIGANALADAFEALESAAKRGDSAFISESTPSALDQYAALIELLRPIGEAEPVHVPGELTAAEARETAERLLGALDDFDDELSAELASKLAGYPFRPTQKALLREAAGYIGDFMYDEAAERVRDILPAIE